MKNENKQYFTPDITDIRIGYEFEFQGLSRGWHKMVFSENDNLKTFKHNLTLEDCVRTPYLTVEQIENEKMRQKFINKGYHIDFIISTHTIEILDNNNKCYFNGECPSINEFRYICKLLKIK